MSHRVTGVRIIRIRVSEVGTGAGIKVIPRIVSRIILRIGRSRHITQPHAKAAAVKPRRLTGLFAARRAVSPLEVILMAAVAANNHMYITAFFVNLIAGINRFYALFRAVLLVARTDSTIIFHKHNLQEDIGGNLLYYMS
jgi:hypothetical protein